MTRYWIIAPYNSEDSKNFDDAWSYDLNNNTIALGWTELDDISKCTKDQIRSKALKVYSEKEESWIKHNITRLTNALWNFYNEIKSGDIIIARRGTKRLIGIGEVIGEAFYSLEEASKRTPNTDNVYCNFIKVKWKNIVIDYESIMFSTFTIYEIEQEKFNELIEKNEEKEVEDEIIVDHKEFDFPLEKQLEDFIIVNFDLIFNHSIELWYDKEGNIGQQYQLIDDDINFIGTIDILAKDTNKNSYIVIELKKGRSSDKVVGQIMRYMGWVQENLCNEGESVHGMIICKEKDKKLEYAIKPCDKIKLKLYKIDFKLIAGM